jgi:hypothetical protein
MANYLKAGGMLKFIDTAEDDVYYFPATKAEMIEVTNDTSVIVTFSQSGDHATQSVDLTCTSGKSDEVAAIMAEYIMTSGSAVGGSAGVTSFAATVAPITDVTGIATAKALS